MNNSYIGGTNWQISDKIYYRLTGKRVQSNYYPIIPLSVQYFPNFIPNKKLFCIFWSKPTFKDIDCQYLLHVFDEKEIDYIISTSSGNTVESLARSLKEYNNKTIKDLKAILLVPEISSFKVSNSVIENNPYVKYIILKNATLDNTRNFSEKLKEALSKSYEIVSADSNLKTAAYSQIGYVLDQMGMLNNDTCYVQTVSGGVGVTGFIEYASEIALNPEILVVQPSSNISTPILDALNEAALNHDPLSVFENQTYETSSIESTLGSTKPIYAIKKFIRWRERGGTILPCQISNQDILDQKDIVVKNLVYAQVYPNFDVGLKFFELEKSGVMAFIGAIKSANIIRSKRIIVNITGRYPEKSSTLPSSATPDLVFDPNQGTNQLIRTLNL
ncbi:MAG: pyridoxal-phosphate dependent enzyme [Promethearchaeota archaeon]